MGYSFGVPERIFAVRAASGRLRALRVSLCKFIFVWGFCMGAQGA
jgi:hypothetical protein